LFGGLEGRLLLVVRFIGVFFGKAVKEDFFIDEGIAEVDIGK
jgi:hypothetical protein